VQLRTLNWKLEKIKLLKKKSSYCPSTERNINRKENSSPNTLKPLKELAKFHFG